MFDPFEKSLNMVKKYVDENSYVYVTGKDGVFAVSVEKYNTPFSSSVYQRGNLDALCADEFFDVAVRFARGEIKWTEPVRKFGCTYNPNKSCGCTDKNCPRALGGVAYRELFSKSCPYRKTRSR